MHDEAAAAAAAMTASHVIVVDVGTRWTRLGFAAEEAPRVTMPSVVGTARHAGQRATLLLPQHDTDVLAGDMAACEAGLLQLRHPVVRSGHTDDVDALEQLLLYALYDRLPVVPETTPFLLLEAADQRRRTRERVAELFFEAFAAPLLGTLNALVATVYAAGRTTGVALDSGAGKTCVGVVVGGYALAHARHYSHVAGNVLTDALLTRLRARGYALSTPHDWERVERLKETLCYAALDGDGDNNDNNDGSSSSRHTAMPDTATTAAGAVVDGGPSMTLPDGERIFVFDDAYALAEKLFCPARHIAAEQHASLRPRSPFGYNTRDAASSSSSSSSSCSLLGWSRAVDAVVAQAPASLQDELYANVVLGGGTTMLRNVEHRLQRELVAQRRATRQRPLTHTSSSRNGGNNNDDGNSVVDRWTATSKQQQQQQQQRSPVPPPLSPSSSATRVHCVAFAERAYAAWLGGSVWASSAAFAPLCVSKAQYHEEGVGVVHHYAF